MQKLIGDFTTIIPLHITFHKGDSLHSAMAAVQREILQALDHRCFDGIDFIRALARQRNQGSGVVIPFVFTSMLVNYDADEPPAGISALGEWKNGISQTSQVYIDHQVLENDEELWLTWDYVDGLFPPGMLDDMFRTSSCTSCSGSR